MLAKSTHITLRDIAKALNLSTSTVSKSLRDSYEIGEQTKKKVLSYAQQVGYRPNSIAKSLKEGKSRSIGVIICSIDNTFVSQMLESIDRACNDRGYSILIMQSKESYEQEKNAIKLLNARGIDGLLISPAYETADVTHINEVMQTGLPVVLFDRLTPAIHTQKVSSHNFQGGYQATSHLLKNGYKKIALLHSLTDLSITVERIEGYKQALAAFPLPIREEYIQGCNSQNSTLVKESIEHALKFLMKLPEPPEAILATSDQISTNVIHIIHKLGLKIPGDLALIGFTNTELADALNPPLSTISQPASEIGHVAAEKLMDLIEGKTDNSIEKLDQTILLDVRLIPRASTKPKIGIA